MTVASGLDRPVFISGCGRSGTTRLVDLLGLHPGISPVYETDFVRIVAGIVFDPRRDPRQDPGTAIREVMTGWSRDLPFRPDAKHEGEQYVHGPHHILFTREEALAETERLIQSLGRGDREGAMRRFVMALFARHAERDGKPAWVSKARYVLMLPLLHWLFADMVFVHIVRDPRDVALSLLARPWGHKTAEGAGHYWRHCVQAALAFAERHPRSYVEIRFEDLIARPDSTLGGLIARLGCDPGMMAGVPAPPPADASRIGRWRQKMPPADQAFFRAEMAPLLDRFGYT